jgi:hypothetical protein
MTALALAVGSRIVVKFDGCPSDDAEQAREIIVSVKYIAFSCLEVDQSQSILKM